MMFSTPHINLRTSRTHALDVGCWLLVVGCSPNSRSGINSFGVRRSAFRVRYSLLFLFAFCLLFGGLPAKAQVSREYQLKAVFLFNFVQFTEWPTNAFADDKSPIVIGIVGDIDPFGTVLEQTVRSETVNGHPLVVEHFPRPADIKTCHLLFIPQPETRQVGDILKAVHDKPVLTVADADNAATSEVMIRFLLVNNKIHFRINVEAARAADLTLSSKLLRVSDLASPGRTPP
jgi:hypothetical protein